MGTNLLSLAVIVESALGPQVEALLAKETTELGVFLGANLTADEIAASASADRKLIFAGLNKGLSAATAAPAPAATATVTTVTK